MANGVRFAPSPTGRFHYGNLRTAWVSQRCAEILGLPWILRFEDIDEPRVLAGAEAQQIADMARLGLHAAKIYRQTDRAARHLDLFQFAVKMKRVYPCYCSRKEVQASLAQMASAPHEAPYLYDGACRTRTAPPKDYENPTIAWRFRQADETGHHDCIVARTNLAGDDFQPAYHWACAIDDWDGNYDLLVRAWDLESALPYQQAIQNWVRVIERSERDLPAVFHTALVVMDNGARLEKRSRGVTLDEGKWSPEDLVKKFSASFSSKTFDFSPGKVWGETRRTITLSELGL